MGVSGAGKTEIGKTLQDALPNWIFQDADQYHPPHNARKIKEGIPLNEEERAVFIDALRADVKSRIATGQNLILGWSALKNQHRKMVAAVCPSIRFVMLEIDQKTVTDRSARRKRQDGTQPGPGIIPDQFVALQKPSPTEALIVSADRPIPEIARIILDYFRTTGFLP